MQISLGVTTYDMAISQLYGASGEPVNLRNQTNCVLHYLCQRAGDVVDRSEICDDLKELEHTSDEGLSQCIREIRAAIGDASRQIVETLPKRGYRIKCEQITNPELDFPKRPTLLISPFKDHSRNRHPGRLNNGMIDEVVVYISRFKEISVLTVPPDRKTGNQQPVGRSVHYLLESSQQYSNGSVRITAWLRNTKDDSILWSDSCEHDYGRYFVEQSVFARRIAAGVGYLIAYGSPPNLELHPESALRYHLQARRIIRLHTRKATDNAEYLNNCAISLDPNSPYGHMGMGYVLRNHLAHNWHTETRERTIRQAVRYSEKALELSLYDYSCHFVRAQLLMQEYRLKEATLRFERAIELNPVSPNLHVARAEALFRLGDIAKAREACEDVVENFVRTPDWFYWTLSRILWADGDNEKALLTMQRMAIIPPAAKIQLAVLASDAGKPQQARNALAEFRKEHSHHFRLDEIATQKRLGMQDSLLERWEAALANTGMH